LRRIKKITINNPDAKFFIIMYGSKFIFYVQGLEKVLNSTLSFSV